MRRRAMGCGGVNGCPSDVSPHSQEAPMSIEHLFEPPPAKNGKIGRSTRIAIAAGMRRLNSLHAEINARELEMLHVPKAWTELPDAHPAKPKKVRVTLLLEPSVAKFYRGYGQGYQALVNDVLATYAQLRIAKLLKATEDGDEGGFVGM
ncbi:MAG: hypothetical protein GKR99_05140 [Rhodobacteraceae bacterium]|nr:hypothetical protein [Paracoccaceae bacterium]